MLRVLLYVVGLVLSTVAAFYSVTGLAFVFAGAFWPVVIMGGALEAAKLIGASWVFRSWRTAPRLLTGYVSIGIVLLMLLTGVGIFGYLSRAYLIQQAPVAQLTSEIDSAQRAVTLAQAQYDRDVTALNALSQGQTTDKVIGKLTESNRLTGTSGAVSVLKTQQSLQQAARKQLTTSSAELAAAQQTLAAAQTKSQLQTVDLGPLMFAAKAWYGTSDVATMDKVVRWFILLIMLVFDPMAIALLLAAQQRGPITISVNSQITDAVTGTAPPAVVPTPPTTPSSAPTLWTLSDHPPSTPITSVMEPTTVLPTDTETATLADTTLTNSQLPLETPSAPRRRGMKAATLRNLRS